MVGPRSLWACASPAMPCCPRSELRRWAVLGAAAAVRRRAPGNRTGRDHRPIDADRVEEGVEMNRSRVAAALALAVATLLAAGCSAGGDKAAGGAAAGGGSEAAAPAAGAPSSGGATAKASAPAVQLVDLGNRIVRKATLSLEVGKARLNDTISRATTIVNRRQGQVDFLRDQSSFSTIELDLAEPGAAGPAVPRTRFAKAWSTAVDGLGAIAAAALVVLVWLAPFALLALIAIWAFHRLRRPAAGVGLAPRPPAT